MPIATLNGKGQITMPIAVRKAMGLHAGAKVDFVPAGDGFKIIPWREEPNNLRGRFAGRMDKMVSLQAMDRAIAAEASVRAIVKLA